MLNIVCTQQNVYFKYIISSLTNSIQGHVPSENSFLWSKTIYKACMHSTCMMIAGIPSSLVGWACCG